MSTSVRLTGKPVPTRDPEIFRAISIFDPHLTCFSPPAYKVDYWPMMKGVIDTVLKFADQTKVDALLWGGDVFHRKASHRNPLWFVTEVMEMMARAECLGMLNLGIAGNHDVKYGSWEQGLKGQPLEVLIAAGRYHLLDHADVVFQLAGDRLVRVAGASYHHGKAERVRLKEKQGADVLISLGHFWFGPETGEFFGEPIFGPDYLGKTEVDVYCIGHHHENQGVQTVDGRYYDSHGSLSRTGLHKSDRERQPAAALIEVDSGIKITILYPKFPSAEETLDFEKALQLKEEQAEMESFLTELSTHEVKMRDPREILDELNPTGVVKVRVQQYLDMAEERAG